MLAPGTATMQTDQTRKKFGFLSHCFGHMRGDRGLRSSFHDFLSLCMTGRATVNFFHRYLE
jgi:hypothetical protein